MSGEEQFQLLISNQDYLNLQAKCNQLQALCQKQNQQNKDYSLKIFDLKEENEALIARNVHNDQKIRELQNLQKSKGAQIVSLLSLNENVMNEMSKKQHQLLKIKKEISDIQKKKDKQLSNLTSKANHLQKCLGQKQNQLQIIKQSLEKQKVEKVKINELVRQLKDENENKIKIFEESNTKLQDQLKSLNAQTHKLQRTIEDIKMSYEKKLQDSQKMIYLLKKQIQRLQYTLVQFSSEKQKLNEKQNVEDQLRVKIKDLENQLVKQKDNSEAIEKQYEQIISNLQNQKKIIQKSKGNSRLNQKSQKDQLQQIKARLQQYFTNLALNLYEVGNLDHQDIRGILVQQEEIVKSYVTDITAPFVLNKKQKGPPQFHKF